MKTKTSIILLTCNRKDFSKATIDSYYERLTNPEFIHLIVVDNNSTDGTVEMLKEYKKNDKIHKLILLGEDEVVNISNAYNMGFKYVESEIFITAQDDVIISKHKPDLVEKLTDLLGKYPNAGMIATRIQHMPNMDWSAGDENIVSARKACSAYFRAQRKSDYEKLGDTPFSKRDWDDRGALNVIRELLNKDGYWAKKLWVNHLGHSIVDNRGYPEGYERMWGWTNKPHDPRKPYPKIDPDTCEPLPGEKIFK